MIKYKDVINVIGVLLILLGTYMLLPLPLCENYTGTDFLALLQSAILTTAVGGILWFTTRKGEKQIGKREGYLIVALGWLAVSLFSSLPYLLSGTFDTLTNALFESVSGLTTTGASVLTDIEAVSPGILTWRSLSQWIGGMGIIVLTVALFPLLGIGGVELFVAEAPGPTSDKLHPRIKETAKRLWLIYVSLTLTLMLILWTCGMTFFDAINHGLTTMATGGFSTKNDSIAHYDTPWIQYPIIIFMFLAGVNYTIIYYSIKGKFKKVWKSDEFKTYTIMVVVLIAIVTSVVHYTTPLGFEKSFRDSAFQVISVITTTGFVSADYTAWTPALSLLFFGMLFMGACAGSTSGGIKIIRHLVFFKNSLLEFKRILHPKAVIKIKVDQELVSQKIITHILVFLLIYLIVFALGSLVMTIILAETAHPLLTSIGAVGTALSNVGPGIGEVGPVDNFAWIPGVGKWFLVFLMLLGRLELFTILILFTPYFWRTN